MKKTIIFLFAGLLVNTAAFAVGPDKQVNCKDIKAALETRLKQQQAAAAQQPAVTDQKPGAAVDQAN